MSAALTKMLKRHPKTCAKKRRAWLPHLLIGMLVMACLSSATALVTHYYPEVGAAGQAVAHVAAHIGCRP